MALGPPVPTTSYVLVYNPSQYMHSIIHGQNLERLDALKHLLECIAHSDLDLITLGSIWLCVTGLLTNDEQQKSINADIRSCALKCVLELIKIDQLQRRFFNIWLTFDFLARYQIENDKDATLWLDCFNALTDTGKRIDLVDDRLRGRLFIQFIHGILNGSLNRNHQAYQILKDLLTNYCHLRHDEIMLIIEYIFRHLNRDEDDIINLNQTSHQQTIKKSFEFLCWLIDYHTLNTTLIHYFIQNIIDLHDKSTFPAALNTELLQLITKHLAKAPWHSTSVISVLCGIIIERLETPIDNNIDPLSTLLFILTQTLINIRQNHHSISQQHIQVSSDDIIHRECFLNTIQKLPLCWLTILHQILIKHRNIHKILVNFHQFLTTIHTENVTCALKLFDMTIWKMMNEIMKISYQYLNDKYDQRTIISARTIYQDCLNQFEELANKLCCLPHAMVTHLFDIKRLTSIPKTPLREQMIQQSINDLLRLIRPNNPEWSVALRELIEYVILNSNESVAIRIDTLTTIFDKYLWFKMTDQITTIGQMILECLENLIHINLNSLTENEYLSKHITMKQNAIQSIFEHYLSDHTIDSNLAQHCYQIIQTIYEQDCQYLTSNDSIYRRLIEFILEQFYNLFEKYLSLNRLTSFNHCSLILNFFLRQIFLINKTNHYYTYLQIRIRLLIWQLIFNIRIRLSDSIIGINNMKTNTIDYGIYRYDIEQKYNENEYTIDLHDYLKDIVQFLKFETQEILEIVLDYLFHFLKEQSLVYLSNINIDELIPLFIDMFHQDLKTKNPTSISFHCLIICTCYKTRIKSLSSIIDCFLEGFNSYKTSFIIMSIQACLISFVNLHDEIQIYLPKILNHLTNLSNSDIYISKYILQFLMHILFENFNDQSLIRQIFQILIDIIHRYQYQTAHNLLLAHTIMCFYFNQLSFNQRQIYSYFLIRSLQQTTILRDTNDSILLERPVRLQRSGSLSSLNDDSHSNELLKRKMTVLDATPSTILNEENQQLKKFHDDLILITINYLNNHLYEYLIPKLNFILLPREVRRHHVNNCWLADEQILYQIKSSYEFVCLSKAKDILAISTSDLCFDDSMKNRFRRYTDGNRKYLKKPQDSHILITCQDDLHIRSLELDTNRSIFNERNLWISVIVRSLTSTKTYLAINLSASSGINHSKNEKLHWFEAMEISDNGLDKSSLIRPNLNSTEHEQNLYSIDEIELKNEFLSIIMNIDRKDEESMLNRHNETYHPQTVHRVPSEARKSIETFDNVEPVRIAKIGVIYIRPGQEIAEINILSNIQTSIRYKKFMSSLAKLKSIKDLQSENFYCPLLDANNPDNCGQYAYVWQNSVYQVLFHTSTTLPNTRADHEFKKKLIGNDYVIIIYNESDYSFDMKTFKSGVCQYVIEVCPQINSNYSRIRIKKRTSQNVAVNELISFNESDYLIIDEHLSSHVRTLALCLCQQSELETRQRSSPSVPYLISPWQSRLQALRSLHTRCLLSYTNRQ